MQVYVCTCTYIHITHLCLFIVCVCICTAANAKSLQSCPTLCDPMDSSPPGSSVHRVLQARILEWGATSFSILTIGLAPKFIWVFCNISWKNPNKLQGQPIYFQEVTCYSQNDLNQLGRIHLLSLPEVLFTGAKCIPFSTSFIPQSSLQKGSPYSFSQESIRLHQ